MTDRWSANRWSPGWRRQLCWAHLARDWEAMVARGGPSQVMGEAVPAQGHQRCHGWPRGRDGTLAQASFAHDMRPVRRDMARLLDAGHTCGVPKTEGTGRDMRKRRQAWWTFVRQAGVDPTHHAAARAMGPGVLWRQGSVGTHSPAGSRLGEAMRTVVATLKPPHRSTREIIDSSCPMTT